MFVNSTSAKKIVMDKLKPRMQVAEMGKGRFFLGVQRGMLLQIADAMYFTTEAEAQEMANKMNEDIKSGDMRL